MRYSSIFRARVLRCMPSASAVLVTLPSQHPRTLEMKRFSNSRTASSKWTPLATMSSTSFSRRSEIMSVQEPGDSSFQLAAGEPVKRLDVFLARLDHHVVGERWDPELYVTF